MKFTKYTYPFTPSYVDLECAGDVVHGMYSTGIFRPLFEFEKLWCPDCEDALYGEGVVPIVEAVLDRDERGRGYHTRYVCEHFEMTETLGQWYRNLQEAKEGIERFGA